MYARLEEVKEFDCLGHLDTIIPYMLMFYLIEIMSKSIQVCCIKARIPSVRSHGRVKFNSLYMGFLTNELFFYHIM